MELCYLKGDALATLKTGLQTTYEKYLTERDNSWVAEVCGENPFVKFRDVPDFELAPPDDFDKGTIDFRNSKILYKHLHFLTPRQAADERFWAGFCFTITFDGVGITTSPTICAALKRRRPLNESRTDSFSTATRAKNF